MQVCANIAIYKVQSFMYNPTRLKLLHLSLICRIDKTRILDKNHVAYLHVYDSCETFMLFPARNNTPKKKKKNQLFFVKVGTAD